MGEMEETGSRECPRQLLEESWVRAPGWAPAAPDSRSRHCSEVLDTCPQPLCSLVPSSVCA